KRGGARGGGLHLHGSGPHQLADHPLPAICAAPAATVGESRPGADTGPRGGAGGTRSAGGRDLQELRTGNPAVSLRRGAAGAGFLQPGAECRAGHRAGGRGNGEDARGGWNGGDRGDRSRRGDRREASRLHLQPVLYHQAAGRGAGPGHRFQDCGRTRRENNGGERTRQRQRFSRASAGGAERSPDRWRESRMKKRILIVEDEEKLRRVIGLQLASAGFEVDNAATAEEGLKIVDRADMVLTDLKLPNMDGLQFLGLIRRQNSQVPVVMMTAFGSVETAVEAMKAGATDFLLKPFSLDHLMQVVNKALEVRALRDENRKLKAELGRRYEFDNIIGRSGAMQEIFDTIERVAPTRATVLLAGESGTGKDLIARAIHFHSPRRDRPLVKINCTAIPENLMESELFGYEKGAFTGANTTKQGKFEQADTGTVFLDEIGDVPGPIQVKLLRILQEREFERLGSNVTRHIDVRVIAATNQDLRAALEQGTFREDLYY